jgi:hypothetical protein
MMTRRVITFPPLVALVVGLVVPRSVFPQVAVMAAHDLAATLAPSPSSQAACTCADAALSVLT